MNIVAIVYYGLLYMVLFWFTLYIVPRYSYAICIAIFYTQFLHSASG